MMRKGNELIKMLTTLLLNRMDAESKKEIGKRILTMK